MKTYTLTEETLNQMIFDVQKVLGYKIIGDGSSALKQAWEETLSKISSPVEARDKEVEIKSILGNMVYELNSDAPAPCIERATERLLSLSKEETKATNEIKALAHNGLPDECVLGYNEVKFCFLRNGDGNKCKQCSDLLK